MIKYMIESQPQLELGQKIIDLIEREFGIEVYRTDYIIQLSLWDGSIEIVGEG